ncbi:TetR/AcrR family transcriptional regulator C-terminal domain-containing protein [Streptomyces sp. NPDC029044]|uniref:TetR/AcrR family transcriptional regulator C-terminal domain-containing protein n=1 Tax=Streptomyces sp. NPDC029044 TaxID=3157198 RepID=UPI0033E1715D
MFTAVVQDGSARVADVLVELIERHLGPVGDADALVAALLALAKVWNKPRAEFTDHFAVVRRLRAQGPTLPRTLLQAWDEAGPQRTQRALAHQLRRPADLGVLDVADAAVAADHFLLLTAGSVAERSHHGAATLSAPARATLITAGVRAFLHGYVPHPASKRQ